VTDEGQARKPRYDAFISYSKSADATLSAVLQEALHRFAKPWYRRRALRVFRDATTLSPDTPLPIALESAIRDSGFFILMASPRSAASPWVQREVEHWLQGHGVKRLILVLTDGSLNWSDTTGDFDPEESTSLPPPLFGAFDAEPLFLDLRNLDTSTPALRDDPSVQDAVATIASVIRGRPKDDVVGEDLAQHRRTLRIAWSAAGLLAVLAVATSLASMWAVQQRDAALQREREARAGQLASDASRLLTEQPEALELATLLAIESIKRAPVGNGQEALASATRLLPGRVAESYGGMVEVLEFSPDNRWLARGDAQMGVMAWDLEKGELSQLSMPAEIQDQLQVRDVEFSRDSKWLAIAPGGPAARVYDLPDGNHEWHFEHDDTVMTVAFDPSARRLATGAKDGRLRVWELATQTLLYEERVDSEEVRAVQFNHDGSLLGVVSPNGPIRLLATDDWRRIELEAVAPQVGLALDFSPDGTMFAVTRGNRAVIWSLDDGSMINTLEHTDITNSVKVAGGPNIWALEFSPDSSLLVTSSLDRTTRFWRPRTGEEVLRFTHRSSVERVAFTANGSQIATAGYGLAQLWSLPEGEEVLRVPTDGGNALGLSEDGSLIATGGNASSVRVMTTANAVRSRTIKLADDAVAVACRSDRPWIATADYRHNVQIWDTTTGELLADSNTFNPQQLQFTRKGDLIVASQAGLFRLSGDGTLRESPLGYERDIAIHDDYVAARERGGAILVWPAAGNADPLRIDAVAQGAIRFNEDGTLLITQRLVDNQATVHVWDARSGQEVWQIEVRSAFGNRLAADAGGNTLAVANQSGLVLYDKQTGTSRELNLDSEIRDLVFSKNGARLSILFNEKLQTYDLKDLDAPPVRIRHDSTVRNIAFNKERHRIATATTTSVTVWDLDTGERLANWSTDGRVTQVCFLADDAAIVTGEDADRAVVQTWQTTDHIDAACARLTRNLTEAEWEAYIPGLPYEKTCPALVPVEREPLVAEMFAPPEAKPEE
jgi:WD40 repeat protein